MFDPRPQPSTSTFELPISPEMYRYILDLPLTNSQLNDVWDALYEIQKQTWKLEGIILTLGIEEDTK